MTGQALKTLRASEKQNSIERLHNWQGAELDLIEAHNERKWRDSFKEWQLKEWDTVKEDKKQFTEQESARIYNETKADWLGFEKEWTEDAETQKKKEIADFKKKHVAGDKRKRDETETELRKQVKNLTTQVDDQGRKMKRLRTRLQSCECGTDDSDDEVKKKPNGPQKPTSGGGKGPGPGPGSGENALSRAGPLPSGKGGKGGTNTDPNKKKTPPWIY